MRVGSLSTLVLIYTLAFAFFVNGTQEPCGGLKLNRCLQNCLVKGKQEGTVSLKGTAMHVAFAMLLIK